MGEVYRARDSRLQRSVALKILPAELSRDERLRARFLREAKAISALAHPNICALHDIGRENGIDFLVLEFVEGPTLAERLRSGPLPIDAVLRIGVEIADALEKAHQCGIVHRDLKPGNVILSKSGAKLLDFGLAKTVPDRLVQSEIATAAKSEERLTRDGMIVGTLDFMAPEQLQGGVVDQRTDIFALGNVLYRMTTGRSPFEGGSDANVIASILRNDPPRPRVHRPDIPPALERLIEACLRKDPAERIQSAHDLKLELQWVMESRGEAEQPPRGSAPRWQRFVPWAIAAIAILLAAYAAWRRPVSAPRPGNFSIELPPLIAGFEFSGRELAISPDGTRLALSLDLGKGRQIYLRSFQTRELTPVPGTRNAQNPFFSPDGKWIAFAAGGKLQKLLLAGGSAVTICDARRIRGASWGSDNTMVFTPGSSGTGLWRVSADGGTPAPVTRLAPNEYSHRWPHFLPDGKHVLFSIDDWSGDYTRKKVAVLDLETGRTKVLVNGGTHPRFAGEYLFFGRERALYAQRFDVERLTVDGLAVPAVDGVMTHAGVGAVIADVSRDGTLVYLPYDAEAEARQLVWVDRRGSAQALSPIRRPYVIPRLSPDGRQLLVSVGESRASDLWLLDIDSNSWSRIAPEGKSLYPLWSRDGRQIYFSSNRAGLLNIYITPADGSGTATRLTDRVHWPFPRSMSSDNTTLLVEEQHPDTSYDIWSLNMKTGHMSPVLVIGTDQAEPAFSPDGRWFAYTSNETGRAEVYVQSFPPGGRKWTVSEDGGRAPRWSSDGREIYFRTDSAMMASGVAMKPSMSIGKPEVLFTTDLALEYDVAPDGQRFLMLRENARSRESAHLRVVLGAFDELRRRVAAQPAQ